MGYLKYLVVILIIVLCIGCIQFKRVTTIPSPIVRQQSIVIDLTLRCEDGDAVACDELQPAVDKLKSMNQE